MRRERGWSGANGGVRSGADPVHRPLAQAGDDLDVAAQVGVQGRITRVHEQGPAFEREQLGLGGDDQDVVRADAADDGGAQLLVAPPEDMALAADDGHDDEGVVARIKKVQQLGFAEVAAGQNAIDDGVDAEQRLGQAESRHDRARRGARAQDVDRARAHARDHLGGDVVRARSSPATPPALALWVRPRA